MMITLNDLSVDLEEKGRPGGGARRAGEGRITNHAEFDQFMNKFFFSSVDRCFDDLFGVVRNDRQRKRRQFSLIVQSGDVRHAVDFR